MRHTFDDFMNELEAEVRAEGPEAVARAEELKVHFRMASQLIARRRELKLTQGDLAKRTGLNQSEISKIERGTSSPNYRTLAKVADGLDADITIVPRKHVVREQANRSKGRPAVRRAARTRSYARAVPGKRRSR